MKDTISIFRLRTDAKDIKLYVLPAEFRKTRVGSVQMQDCQHTLCAGINIRNPHTITMMEEPAHA